MNSVTPGEQIELRSEHKHYDYLELHKIYVIITDWYKIKWMKPRVI